MVARMSFAALEIRLSHGIYGLYVQKAACHGYGVVPTFAEIDYLIPPFSLC